MRGTTSTKGNIFTDMCFQSPVMAVKTDDTLSGLKEGSEERKTTVSHYTLVNNH